MNSGYTSFPALSQWLNDSRGNLSKHRGGDDILVRIDQLVEAHASADSQMQQLVRVDLFWCLDYWLKVVKATPAMDDSREPSVQKLYVTVVNLLCANFNCQVNTLVNKLEEAFGRTVGSHGLQVDLGKGLVKYFSDTERKLYQLQFRGGLAYQRPWWEVNADLSALVPVESSRASDPSAFFGTGAMRTGFAGFVMSMGRDFYMAKHGGPNEKNSRIFHSSYLGENMISCAGTMPARSASSLPIAATSAPATSTS
jgi:hypothetical protein